MNQPCSCLLVLQPERLDARLHLGAGLPLRLHRLVAAEVDLRAGEERHHLGEHVLHERDGVIGRIEDVVEDAPLGGDLGGLARDAEVGVGGNRGDRVARHLDLGHDLHEPRPRVLHDLPHVVLRVEAAVAHAVVALGRRVVGRVADERLRAPRAHGGQPRVFLDLDPPALVVRQVPVERVQLVQREEVDVLLHELLRHEVPRHVEVRPAPPEARRVLDPHGGQRPVGAGHVRRAEDGRRQQLADRLHGVERAGEACGAHLDAVRRDLEPVALRAEPGERRVVPEDHAVPRRHRAHGHRQRVAGRRPQVRRQPPRGAVARLVRDDHGVGRERERPGLDLQRGRLGHDRDGRRRLAPERRGPDDRRQKDEQDAA